MPKLSMIYDKVIEKWSTNIKMQSWALKSATRGKRMKRDILIIIGLIISLSLIVFSCGDDSTANGNNTGTGTGQSEFAVFNFDEGGGGETWGYGQDEQKWNAAIRESKWIWGHRNYCLEQTERFASILVNGFPYDEMSDFSKLTVEFWYFPYEFDIDNNVSYLLTSARDSFELTLQLARTTENKIGITFDRNKYFITQDSLICNKWQKISFIIENTNKSFSVFIDNKEVLDSIFSNPVRLGNRLYIGEPGRVGLGNITGKIDELKMWKE